MHLQEKTLFDFDVDPQGKGGQGHTKCAQYPLHHVTYVPKKFDVATSHS